MNKNITLNNINYELVKDYHEGYNHEAILEKLTDYFTPYDYIVGDWAYGKLRLKGFYKDGHANLKEYNDFKNVDNYLSNNCAYDCKHFIIQKIN